MAKVQNEKVKSKKAKAVEDAPKKKKGFPPAKDGKAKKAKSKKKALPTFKAPADFKPHFLLVQLVTEADGLLASNVSAVRYQGKFARDADDKKKFDMAAYDMKTLIGIAARFAGVSYKATNDKKYPVDVKERVGFKGAARLPAKTTFQVLLRVGKKAADNSLTAGVKGVWQAVTSKKSGRLILKELEKTDVCYRALRKASRTMPAAFANVQMPPKRTRGGKKNEEDEG